MLKNLGIDLHQSEKKTLYSFLSLYTFLCLVIIFFVSFLYFTFQKDLMLQNKREVLQAYSKDFILRLKDLHINFDKYKLLLSCTLVTENSIYYHTIIICSILYLLANYFDSFCARASSLRL